MSLSTKGMKYHKLNHHILLTLALLAAWHLALAITWAAFPSLIDTLGKGLMGLYQFQYRLSLSTAFTELKNNNYPEAAAKLEMLLDEFESVKKFDRLSRIKSDTFQNLIFAQEKNLQYKKALNTVESYLNFDSHNLWARLKKIELLSLLNTNEKLSLSKLQNLYQDFPNSFQTLSLYAESLINDGQVSKAFLISHEYWKRIWNGMDKRYWEVYWDTGDRFNTNEKAQLFPKKTQNYKINFKVQLPKGTYKRIRIEPTQWTRFSIQRSRIIFKNNSENKIIDLNSFPVETKEIHKQKGQLIIKGNDPKFWINFKSKNIKFQNSFDLIFEAELGPVYPSILLNIIRSPMACKKLIRELQNQGNRQTAKELEQLLNTHSKSLA